MNEQIPPSDQNTASASPQRRGSSLFWPLLLIIVGVILLLNSTNLLSWTVWRQLHLLWPFVLILLGVNLLLSREAGGLRRLINVAAILALVGAGIFLALTAQPEESTRGTLDESWPLSGVEQGRVDLQLGIGELELGSLSESSDFARLNTEGSSDVSFERNFEIRGGTAYLELSGPHKETFFPLNLFPGKGGRNIRWQLDLSPRVALEIDVETGVGESRLDLSELQVEDLVLNSGIGEVEVVLPARVQEGNMEIHAGIGQVTVIVPEGVAIELSAQAGLGDVSVDTERFPRTNGLYRSPDYDDARYSLQIEIYGGVGEIEVR
ncbi:MAG: hypothetical protein JXA37_11760 [Chloroflexia bacterium]|nr:hypothetical protein [Chloroflexia bacterium]